MTALLFWESRCHNYIVVSYWRNVRGAYSTQWRYIAQFQFLSFSKVCYSFLRNLQFVYGSGNGNVHDYITRRNKTKKNWEIEIGQLYMSSTLTKVMLFIPWHPTTDPISSYWRGTLSHTDFQFLHIHYSTPGVGHVCLNLNFRQNFS